MIASALLAVHEVSSSPDIIKYREAFKPTYIHVLSHGALTPGDPLLPYDRTWGLRLGEVGQPGVEPADIADALRPNDDLPVVVTIAACDSGNQSDPIYAQRSIAQELHRLGVPVVIGSQLPLTKPGSRSFTRLFYQQLLQGVARGSHCMPREWLSACIRQESLRQEWCGVRIRRRYIIPREVLNAARRMGRHSANNQGFERALGTYDWAAARTICSQLVGDIDTAVTPYPEKPAKQILNMLRRKRRFDLMGLVADRSTVDEFSKRRLGTRVELAHICGSGLNTQSLAFEFRGIRIRPEKDKVEGWLTISSLRTKESSISFRPAQKSLGASQGPQSALSSPGHRAL